MSHHNTISNRNSLAHFVESLHTEADCFAEIWMKGYAKYPACYPLEMEAGNIGSWNEQFVDFFMSGDDFSETEINDNGNAEITPLSVNTLQNKRSLAYFVYELHSDIRLFEQNWRRDHKADPERFPLEFPEDNLGLWLESFVFSRDHEEDAGQSPR